MTILLFAAVGCLIVSFGLPVSRGKWMNSAGLLFDVAGVVQLHISGLFDQILKDYSDEKAYPYGPPSHITRQIIDNPDTPFRTWIRNTMFFKTSTGFYLLLVGFAFQLLGTWN